MTEARRRVKGARRTRVCFKHVPREENALADWLCNVALKHKADARGVELLFPNLTKGEPPPVTLDLRESEQVPATPVHRIIDQ